MVREAGANYIEAAHHWVGREGYQPRFIVLHGTAGGTSAQNIANYFAQASTEASTNYVIDTDGTFICCVDENDAPWANGVISGPSGTSGDGIGNGYHDGWWDSGINPNLISISIEHVKPSTNNSDQLTSAQQQASFTLIEHICTRWGIPSRKANADGGITGHYSIDPVNRQFCPGVYPWNDLFVFLGGSGEIMLLTIDQVSGYFEEIEKDKRWHCKKTGYDIAFSILDFYRKFGSDLCGVTNLGLPITGEQPANGKSGVTLQRFERGVVCYDPQRALDHPAGLSTQSACYLMHIDSGPGADPRVAQYQAINNNLNTQLKQAQTAGLASQYTNALKALKPFIDTLP